jgi:hypothetical protein
LSVSPTDNPETWEINMAKETAAQKRTRIALLLADFDARNRELRKLTKIVEGLKEQVKEIDPGTYGDWQRSDGTPREILDQAAVRQDYAERGVPLPMKVTDAPAVVSFLAGNK